MLILSGWASFVGLLGVVALGALFESGGADRPLAYALAGAALAVFGWMVNSDGNRHRIFWIPIQWWGLAIGIGALAGL